MAFDHRGWTSDACWLDTSWNPQWFVAAADRDRTWTVEAAIPWIELTASPPRAGTAWAIHAERLTPSEALSSTQDDTTSDFKLLLFE